MPEKVTAVIKAFNEERYISRVLGALVDAKQRGYVNDILVVDDGSTDRTAHEAWLALGGRQEDFRRAPRNPLDDGSKTLQAPKGTILSHPHNRKMSGVYITAVNRLWGKADVMLMMDADLFNPSAEHVRQLVEPIKGQDRILMVRADSHQEGENGGPPQHCPALLSGLRSIKMKALNPLRLNSAKWVELLADSGNAPELALETLVADERKLEVNGLGILSRARGKGMTPLEQIVADTFHVQDTQEWRDDKAKAIRLIRAGKKAVPAQGGKPTGDMETGLPTAELDRIREELETRRGNRRLRNPPS